MNITMKRTDLIAKLEEMLPLYRAEDKRLRDLYNAEMKEYARNIKANARTLAAMKQSELVDKATRFDCSRFLRTGHWDRNYYASGTYVSHSRLDGTYNQNYDYPQAPRSSYVELAEHTIKHLKLSSVRQFTLAQDNGHRMIYHLVTFEPYTETA